MSPESRRPPASEPPAVHDPEVYPHERATDGRGRSNAAQLRDDIDSGRTGDKVDFPDPAAAPLGTDAEAGGAPPSAAEVEEARAYEEAPGLAMGRRGSRSGIAPLLIGVAAIGVLVFLAIYLAAGF